jgi:hypothetical protein
MQKSEKNLQIIAWSLSSAAVLIAFIGWAGRLDWKLTPLSTYSLFPLLGLLALSLMWAHYMMAAIRKYTGTDKAVLKSYFESTSMAVLALILLHPGLLIWQLWRDGFGLPPDSYIKNYVAPELGWVALLGTLSLLVFLAYELRHFYGKRPWWKYVQYASDAAMFAVFYHSLKLGSTLNSSWLQAVWWLYVISYISALLYIYTKRRSR